MKFFIQCKNMSLSQLLDVSENLSITPPPSTRKVSVPHAANKIATGCSSCREGYADAPGIQWFSDPLLSPPTAPAPTPPQQQQQVWQSTADDLLFADDEFAKGLVDTPQAAPYSNPLMNPSATAYAGAVNALDMSKALATVTSPNNFKTAIGAQGLGAGTTSSFVVPQQTPAAPPPIASSTTQSWMPLGLSNTQALVLATVVCTAMLLLFFIVGMSSAQSQAPALTDPLLGI
jgi:hypothetical protein